MPTQSSGWRSFPPALVIGFALLVAMVTGSFVLSVRLARNIEQTAQSWEYRRVTTDLLNQARDAEIGQRGYLVTGDRVFLAPYQSALGEIDATVAAIQTMQRGRGARVIAEVRPFLDAKLAEMREVLRLRDSPNPDAAVVRLREGHGKRLMDRMRAILERERKYALDRSLALGEDSRSIAWWLTFGLAGGFAAVILLLVAWVRAARLQLVTVDRARIEAEQTLAALKTENAGRAAAEEQVRQLQKMESIGQLTGGIAHDFNNMLAVVSGGLELAQRKLRDDPDKAERYIENAREGATRAAALTSRLLAFSRRQPLAPQPLDVNKLLRGMGELLTRTLGDNIVVECVDTAGLWRAYADPGELENAVLNLAVNARDAMPDGGKLTIDSANAHIDDDYARTRNEVEAGQYVVICVTDTGTGMGKEVIDRAFDPFFTTKSVGKGTGLGLSQVFGFAKQSGGHVAIYSEIGEGTTVKLYLPRYQGSEELAAGHKAEDGPVPGGSSHEIILVVEDEQRVRHFAIDVLRELGYSTVAAGSPAEALRLLEENPEICLLFTDIVMPDMNGRRLADLALASRPDLKVLFTTGYTRNAVVHNGMLDIGVAFLPKPYTIAALARKVRDVIDGRGVNRAV